MTKGDKDDRIKESARNRKGIHRTECHLEGGIMLTKLLIWFVGMALGGLFLVSGGNAADRAVLAELFTSTA